MAAEHLLTELADPACFPHAPARVEIIQTHLSVVCLAGDLVYKLKKAVTLPFVDFAPLTARRQACRDEVRLNRRLCPEVYIGAAALRRIDGRLRFAAPGDDDAVDDLDVAVVMRRLPQHRMLDELVRSNRVTDREIRELATHMAKFHAAADRSKAVTEAGSPQKLVQFAADNFAELRAVPGHGLPVALMDGLRIASAASFARLLPALEHRAATGRVVDGHGDLHCRNVCMTSPPSVYDCIEFEPAFRCGDAATEIAFLAMDLRYRGAPDLAAMFVDAYAGASGDRDIATFLPMLCSYRAMVRAKVAALAAAEPEIAADDRASARRSARQHLLLAAAYALEGCGPRWIVVCGPPASGKSQLCRRLVAAMRWEHLSTDVVRKRLAGVAPTTSATVEHYSAEFSERTYAKLLAGAAARTREGAPVVLLDGNFPTSGHRNAARDAARVAGVTLSFVHVAIDADAAVQRAAARMKEIGNVSDADAEVTRELHSRFEEPSSAEQAITLDGALFGDRLVEIAIARLLQSAGGSRKHERAPS